MIVERKEMRPSIGRLVNYLDPADTR